MIPKDITFGTIRRNPKEVARLIAEMKLERKLQQISYDFVRILIIALVLVFGWGAWLYRVLPDSAHDMKLQMIAAIPCVRAWE